jgi:hypothetical protein
LLPGAGHPHYQAVMRIATVLVWLGLGCADMRNHDGRMPGEPLGTFHVSAALEASSCGPGALGSTSSWEFDVKLSRDGSRLFWLNGAAPVAGHLGPDGRSFGFETTVTVEVEPARADRPGCLVERSDRAAGALEVTEGEVAGFDGGLEYAYSTASGSDCSSLVGVSGGFAALPCSLGYAMAAKQSEPAPD